jgi:hypothetical protein
MQGLCTGHDNPDLWFSESIDSDNERVGTNENAPEYKQRIANVVSAIAICNACAQARLTALLRDSSMRT